MNNKDRDGTTVTENGQGQMKIFFPNKLLECLPRSSCFPKERLRWNTNEEIASYLISLDRHEEWLSCSLKTRPQNGSIILYNRKKVKYRKDGYCWKKRKDGKTTREDHMKLKCLYGCYVHSSIVPTFHRRCYWLLQNPDMVLVHYLNVPSGEDHGKACGPLPCAVADRRDSLRWSRDELLAQLKPMFHSIKWSCGGNGPSEFFMEQLAQQIVESQQTKPQPRTHTCLCSSTLASPGAKISHRCNSTKHRIISPKLPATCPSLSPSPVAEGDPEGGDIPAGDKGTHPQVTPAGCTSPEGKLEGVSLSSSSPPQPHHTAITNGNTNGFHSDRRGLTTVALPQNAVIVMTTAGMIRRHGGGEGESSLSLTRSGQLVLSPIPPSPPTMSSPTPAPPPTVSSPIPGVATLNLTLLPSPVIGGLLLTPHPSSSCSPSLLHPPTPSSPPPCLPPVFDPDSFLNSPKQGQTYGGPLPSSSPPLPSSPLPSSTSPLPSSTTSPQPSSSPHTPSLAVSLSPTSPPSSLSSLSSEADRRTGEREVLQTSSPSLPPSLSLSPSQSSPLCLESVLGLGPLGGTHGESGERRGGGHPPTKLALLQRSHSSQPSSLRQHHRNAPSLLLYRQETQQTPASISEDEEHPLVLLQTNTSSPAPIAGSLDQNLQSQLPQHNLLNQERLGDRKTSTALTGALLPQLMLMWLMESE
ncbi:hypothetical protein DPEC_G00106950 [Dallia pectoralis]|uniref:Uncharacterized protein n=1 Tax=Dallia pectoralis TaxID=75939 RepID=A0ACC2GY08_DALPE|nr:hypothetical protein DPEC_G00106950 [Dallia pectoralis]